VLQNLRSEHMCIERLLWGTQTVAQMGNVCYIVSEASRSDRDQRQLAAAGCVPELPHCYLSVYFLFSNYTEMRQRSFIELCTLSLKPHKAITA